MSRLLCLLACSLLAPADDPSRADLERFQGTWKLVAMESEGEAAPEGQVPDYTATYEGNRVTLRAGEKVRRRGIITLDATRSPRAINTWDTDGPYEDRTVPGIYEIEGDTLRLCFGGPGEPRPKEFTTKEGKAALMVVYKRQGK